MASEGAPPAHGKPAGRGRSWLSTVLVVVGCVLLAIGLLASWAATVVYESDTFADRSVAMLDEPEVRRELADRLTEELARAGNQQAVNFRPAFQLAVEAAIDTDTFRSLFRTAVKRTHQAVLASQDGTGSGLDLSDSVTIIVSNLSLPSSAAPGQAGGGLDNSLGDVTQRLSDLRVWSWEDYAGGVTLAGLVGGPLVAAAAIAVAPDRRRTVRRLGWGVTVVGVVLVAIVLAAQALAGSQIADGPLSRAVAAGLGNVLADLRTIGLWVAAYGFLLAAATRRGHVPLPTPPRVWARVRAWVDRRRATTGGTVVVGAGAVLAGMVVVSSPGSVLSLAVMAGGVWLSYLGVAQLTRLFEVAPAAATVASPAEAGAPVRRRPRALVAGAVGVALVVLLGVGAYISTNRAATAAEAAGAPQCNGEAALCDVPLNLAMYAGSHNAMSSALYPGWLFAEQTSTLTGQLDAGVRALLIDTHYGIPSNARLPGSETTVVITDRAAELARPPGDSYDPEIAARAQQVAANAPPRAGARRDVYLCHNFCEMGAVSFSDQMVAVRRWLEHNPEEVVMLVIEDHTTPEHTSAALEAAGLADRAWTLDPTRPIPTLGDLVDAGRNLVVFAENAGPGSPPWYQPAYEWFQETPYAWRSVGEMTCAPNRGSAANPFMLVNHWVGHSPPDPGKTGREVNTEEVLEARIRACVEERGVVPNVVAVDFAERGALMAVVQRYNEEARQALGAVRGQASGATTTTVPGTPRSTTPPGEVPATSSGFVPPTPITSLTGGDPVAFCAATGDLVDAMVGWALADLAKPAGARGLPALTYGPLAERAIAAALPAAPVELAAQLEPAAAQADAAVEALRQAGLDQGELDELADLLAGQLAGPNPDSGVAEQLAVEHLERILGRDATVALAQSFDAEHPTTAAVFDLGDISAEVATSSGYGCLVTT